MMNEEDIYEDDYDDEYNDDDYEEGYVVEENEGMLKTFKTAKKHLRDRVSKGSGINFHMIMEYDLPEGKKGWRVYSRNNQPCYGEMRKYHASHKDEYTNPPTGDGRNMDTYRPSDLHHPFPDGRPVAVAFRQEYCGSMQEFMFSKASPWMNGPYADSVETTKSKDGYGYEKIEVIFWDTRFDPTVIVNLMNCAKSISTQGTFDLLVKNGFSEIEALLVCFSANYSTSYIQPGGFSKGYYSPNQPSVRRIFDRDPRDLTGGMFIDRYDYNRVQLHNVFQREDITEGSDPLFVEITKDANPHPTYGMHGFKVMTEEEFVSACRMAIDRLYKEETMNQKDIAA